MKRLSPRAVYLHDKPFRPVSPVTEIRNAIKNGGAVKAIRRAPYNLSRISSVGSRIKDLCTDSSYEDYEQEAERREEEEGQLVHVDHDCNEVNVDEDEEEFDDRTLYEQQFRLAGAIYNDCVRRGLLPEPARVSLEWEAEMGTAFDEALAEAQASRAEEGSAGVAPDALGDGNDLGVEFDAGRVVEIGGESRGEAAGEAASGGEVAVAPTISAEGPAPGGPEFSIDLGGGMSGPGGSVHGAGEPGGAGGSGSDGGSSAGGDGGSGGSFGGAGGAGGWGGDFGGDFGGFGGGGL